MKTFKILFAAIIFVGFTTSLVAQVDQPDADLRAEATIFTVIEITAAEEVNFGGVEANNENARLDPTDGSVTSAGLGGVEANLGRFDISGAGDADILLTFSTDEVDLHLNGDDTEPSIGYTPEFAYEAGSGSSNGSEITSNEVSLDSNGAGELFVGGELGDRSNTDAGVYSNDEAVNVTVEYN